MTKSFGDGPGVYKREIEKLGHVKLYDAFDGAPYCEETSVVESDSWILPFRSMVFENMIG